MKRLALGITRLLIVTGILVVAVGCGAASPTTPSTGGSPTPFSATSGAQVLVDASKDGGVWWFPQSGTFKASESHQGKALAEAMRARGLTVDELPRGAAITSTLLANYHLIIRVGNCTQYTSAEVSAYEQQLSREMTLVLLTDHMNGGCSQTDPLGFIFGGITWAGAESGTIDAFGIHPITNGVTSLTYNAGATVVSMASPHSVEVLGFIGPSRKPVMGVINGRTAKIFFLGDSNGIEGVPQPFVNNLITWAFQ